MFVITHSELAEELLDECINLDSWLGKNFEANAYKVQKQLLGWWPIGWPTYTFTLYQNDEFLLELTGLSSASQVSALIDCFINITAVEVHGTT